MDLRVLRPLRDDDAPVHFESFLVAAVVSFLGIRAFLTATGFPKVGGGGLHIAHMLWGGALMLVALLLLLAFLDRPIHHLAAIVAGLGFGTFIDEIGKFVTADNDYFFRPAVALIYVVFVIVFLVTRFLAGRRQLTPGEALANALDRLEGTLDRPPDARDRVRIERLLDSAAAPSVLVDDLRRYVRGLPSEPGSGTPWASIAASLARRYERLAGDPRFDAVLSGALIVYTVAAVASSLLVLTGGTGSDAPDSVAVAALGQLISTLAGAALIARGVVALPDSRAEAYRWFLRGLMVWILITQVFIFYRSQLAGLGGLAVDVAAYVTLRFALASEVAGGRRHASGAEPSSRP
jgi:hypothetical protein